MFSKLFVPGWGVEWISITTSTGDMFSCPFNGWLKNGEGNSLTVNCTSSGDYCHLQVTCVTNIARMFVKFVLSFHLAHARVCQILGNSGKAFKSRNNQTNTTKEIIFAINLRKFFTTLLDYSTKIYEFAPSMVICPLCCQLLRVLKYSVSTFRKGLQMLVWSYMYGMCSFMFKNIFWNTFSLTPIR